MRIHPLASEWEKEPYLNVVAERRFQRQAVAEDEAQPVQDVINYSRGPLNRDCHHRLTVVVYPGQAAPDADIGSKRRARGDVVVTAGDQVY